MADWQGALKRMRPLGGVALLALALLTLHHLLATTPPRAILDALLAVSPRQVAAALLLTVVGYGLLTVYDVLAWRHVGRSVPYPEIAQASFVGYGLSHTLGLSLVTGSLARDRIHGPRRQLPAGTIAAVVAFCGLTSFLGYLVLTAVAMTVAPGAATSVGLPASTGLAAGLVAGALVAAYLALCAWRRAPLVVRGRAFALPRPRLALAQVLVGGVEWVVAAWALHVLLPGSVPLPAFVAAFVGAKTASFLIHTPGGLGVFEAGVLALLPHEAPAAVMGALLAYRAVHFLLPFLVAALLLGLREAAARRPQPAA